MHEGVGAALDGLLGVLGLRDLLLVAGLVGEREVVAEHGEEEVDHDDRADEHQEDEVDPDEHRDRSPSGYIMRPTSSEMAWKSETIAHGIESKEVMPRLGLRTSTGLSVHAQRHSGPGRHV